MSPESMDLLHSAVSRLYGSVALTWLWILWMCHIFLHIQLNYMIIRIFCTILY